MNDKKFNLKNYQKINGDEHIDMRLEQSRQEAPNVINERQLEVGRVDEKNVTIEKLLEDKRTGEATELTEKQLDTHKPKFANKYRNPEAFQGDMNKLEEQRLQNNPVEKEKYDLASETASQFRWWEEPKSPDGLKLAQKKTEKTAQGYEAGDLGDVYDSLTQVESKDPSESRLKDYDEFNVTDTGEKDTFEPDEPEEIEAEEENIIADTVRMKADKDIYQPNRPDLSGIYFLFNFDPREFPIDLYIDEKNYRPEAAARERKQDIMNEVIAQISEKRPELGQKLAELSPAAFDSFRIDEQNGTIRAAIAGEQWVPFMKDFVSTPAAMDAAKGKGKATSEEFAELSYQEQNMDGTPMAIGKVQLLEDDIAGKNPDALADMLVAFIKKQHPFLDISRESLDLSKIDTGEILYMTSISPEAIKSKMSAEEELAAQEARLEEAEKQPEWQQLGYDSEAEWAEDQREMQAMEATETAEEDIPVTDLGEDEYTETEEEWKERLRQMNLAEQERQKQKATPSVTSGVKKK